MQHKHRLLNQSLEQDVLYQPGNKNQVGTLLPRTTRPLTPTWKEFDTVKTFRAIKDKISLEMANMSFEQIKEKIAKETEKMTFAEFKEYLNKNKLTT